jgi:hypothetical protein
MADADSIKPAAAEHFQCAATEVGATDLTARHPWLHKHGLYLAADPKRRMALIAAGGPSGALIFDEALGIPANLKTLNQLLQAEEAKLPEGLPAAQLAWVTRAFLAGPGGFVGCAAFWAEQKDALKLWTSPCPRDGPVLFRKYCQDPQLARRGDQWSLTFYYFTNKGGVEVWKANGDARQFLGAVFERVEPDRKFFFPYA